MSKVDVAAGRLPEGRNAGCSAKRHGTKKKRVMKRLIAFLFKGAFAFPVLEASAPRHLHGVEYQGNAPVKQSGKNFPEKILDTKAQ